MNRTLSLALLLLFTVTAYALDPGQQINMNLLHLQSQQLMFMPAQLNRMRVYLKNGPKNPPLDSFRLIQGNSELWRYEKEDAVFRKGVKISYRLSDLDSVVFEDGSMAFPAPNGRHLLFLQQAGAVTQYNLAPKAESMPFYLRKGDGEIMRASTRNIRDLVSDDPESLGMINRYAHRWVWRGGIMAAGAALVGTGLALAVATEVEDESGDRKPSTPIPGIMVLTGLTSIVIPVTPLLNFIWRPLPQKSLNTYNRNRVVAH